MSPTWREAFPRPVALFCLAVLLVQGALVAALLQSAATGRPHDVPIAVVAPAALAEAYAGQVGDLAGRPFDPVAVEDNEAARRALQGGAVVAVLEVEPIGTADSLVLHASQDPRLNETVTSRLRAVERGYDRTVDVEFVDSTGAPAPGQGGAAGKAHDLTLAANLAGFFMVLVVSLVRGPVARTLGLGVARVLLLGLLGTGVGAVLAVLPATAVDADLVALIGLTALAVAVGATITLALEAVAGLAGLAVTATLFLVAATPLLTRTDVHLLPQPWRWLTPWTPPGAMLEEVTALASFGPSGLRRSLLVLVAYLGAAIVTLLVARRVRTRAEVGDLARRDVVLWRVRAATVAVPVGVLLLGAVALVPQAVVDAAPLGDGAAMTACLDVGRPRTVRDLNRAITEAEGDTAFQGGDVGAETLLQDGRRLWAFGDTLRGPDVVGNRLVRNSMLVTDPECLRVVVPSDNGPLLPDRPDGVGYWPMSLTSAEYPSYDLVTVTAQRVRASGEGAFGFEVLGPAIGLVVVPHGETPQLITLRDVGPDDPDRSRPVWGAASAVDGDWLYLYGTATPGAPYVFGYSLRVARVPVDEVLDLGAWRYWDGTDWVTDPEAATELLPAVGGVSQTLSVFEQDGTWYALSKQGDFVGTDIAVWTATAPTGPFGPALPVADLPSDTARGVLRYMPLAHPDLLPRPGTVVVSYSRNRTAVGSLVEHPHHYRIRFLRVDLP